MTRLLLALHHYSSRVCDRSRALIAALTGVTLGPQVRIGADCEVALGPAPARRGEILLGDRTRLERGVLLHPYGGRISTGIDVYIGPYTTIYGHGGVEIGKDTLISMHCRILSSDHTFAGSSEVIRSLPDVRHPTRIGADVWLGAGVTVLSGISIGDGCVVGAGAVVTQDLPPYSKAVGVPARVCGQRR